MTKLPPQSQPVCVADYEKLAASRMPRNSLDYYRSGANNEVTLRDNESAFNDWLLMPRMLRGVANRRLSTTLLGQSVRSPIGVAPTAMQRLASDRGELDTAEAAAELGICLTVSTIATCSLEEVAEANGQNSLRWFQLYVYKDRQLTQQIVQRAELAGYKALVLTVDTPLFGQRYADARNGFSLPSHLRLANFQSPADADGCGSKEADGMSDGQSGVSALTKYSTELFDPQLNWDDVKWLARISKLPIVIKGIVRADDAISAIESGASGIWVSNHGARQLDTVPATIDTLPSITAAVNNRAEIYMDGGVRTGTDALKALALGARAVFVGRPVLWGLACANRQGVQHVLSLLNRELDLAMALCGVRDVGELGGDASLVVSRGRFKSRL